MSNNREVCKHCGADEGLHHYETMQCPRGGIEAPIGRKQEWMQDTYEVDHSQELAALRTDNAALSARVAELEAVIALNKYVTPPFDLTDDATVQLAIKCAELEAQINTGKVAAAAAIDYLDSLEYSGHCYQLLLNWYSATTQSAQPVTLTPRQCVSGRECYRKGWEAACEAAADLAVMSDQTRANLSASIRTLTPPDDCGDCNPLKPDGKLRDALIKACNEVTDDVTRLSWLQSLINEAQKHAEEISDGDIDAAWTCFHEVQALHDELLALVK